MPPLAPLSRRSFLQGVLGAAAYGPIALAAGPSQDTPLRSLAAMKGIRFGTKLGLPEIHDARNVALIDRECDMIVPENAFKMYAILPDGNTKPQYADGDQVVAFAKAHRKALRGHTLLWMNDEVTPAWLVNHDFGPHPKVAAEAFIRSYVHEVTQHFGSTVVAWDVVNEAINVGTGELRSSVFTRILGRDAIRIAFEAAHESMPGAQLFYNDYMDWRSTRSAHRQGVLDLLRWLQDQHAPIGALGVQSHIKTPQTPFDPDGWGVFLHDVAATGLDMAITEFDVDDSLVPGSVAERDALSAHTARLYLDQMLDFKQVKTFMLWGICDRYSYLREERKRADGAAVRPDPYDDQYQPKALREAIALSLKAAPVRT